MEMAALLHVKLNLILSAMEEVILQNQSANKSVVMENYLLINVMMQI